jgi:SAM-dependent methyltransferase
LGNEASKTRNTWGDEVKSLFKGSGLDIGAGKDLIHPSARPFDKVHGDANFIDEVLNEQFDYVFSSHCLEHMHDPADAILRWWKLVKPGGHLIVIVPDEDLYEQGFWPSPLNADHKATFRVSETTWSPVSFRVQDLIKAIPNSCLLSLERQYKNYDWSLLRQPITLRKANKLGFWIFKKYRKVMATLNLKSNLYLGKALGVPVEQDALSQIQFILRKNVSR